MFKTKIPIINSCTNSSSGRLPQETKMSKTSFLKKSTTNLSLNNLNSNGAISNSSFDSFARSKDSFGDDIVKNTQNINNNNTTTNNQDAEGETVMIYARNNNGTFDEIKPDVTKQYTYFFRDHKVTHSDYVNATYAALTGDYCLLDYIDNAYSGKICNFVKYSI